MQFVKTHSVIRMSAAVLVMVCGGCGSSVPDESANLQPSPLAYTNQAGTANSPPSRPVEDGPMAEKQIKGNMSGTASVNESDDRTSASISSIPLSVTRGLQSPEARDRYRALDHWEAKDSKAPLDPVFEALEDDDPAVRAKATAIVERYWEAEQEQTVR